MADDLTPALSYSDDHATFGDRLAAARDGMGMTQAQLAKRLGVKRSTLVNWEDDRSEPRANRLSMLAGILNVSLIWLMTGEGDGVDAQGASTESPTSQQIFEELSAIRVAHRQLAERSGRLEKRLRALLAG